MKQGDVSTAITAIAMWVFYIGAWIMLVYYIYYFLTKMVGISLPSI